MTNPIIAAKEHTAPELLSDMQRKDALYRLLGTIFVVVATIFLVALVTIQVIVIREIQKQSRKNQQGIAQIEGQMQCIATFFTQRDRMNLVITDVKQCSQLLTK